MKKRRHEQDPIRLPDAVARDVATAIAWLSQIPALYRTAHELGGDPRGGSDVHVASGPSDYVPVAAVDNARAIAHRDLCRKSDIEIVEGLARIGNAHTWLTKAVAPGYRQPPRDKAHAIVSEAEFQETLARRARGELT